MPCAESRIICARRHVTTDPEDRRTIRNSFCPSSGSISRTRTRSATPRIIERPAQQTREATRRAAQNRANHDGYGTSPDLSPLPLPLPPSAAHCSTR